MLSLKRSLVSRYVDVTGLLLKYGRADLVREAGLPEALGEYGKTILNHYNGPATPEMLARDLEERGPVYVKLGQLLSTRSDLLPEPYLKALARLQDNVEPVPIDVVRQTITEELGIWISRGFADFSDRPLAAASLGQVHRAVLRDGREVVVKVQRPDVRSRIMADLEALTELAEFLDAHTTFGREMDLTELVGTLHDTILRELDYRLEAENARSLGQNLQNLPLLQVPQPIADHVSARVLTMDYVSGVKITKLSPTVLLELDGEALADELFRGYLQQVLSDGCFHSDPHPGNLLLTRDHRIALMDFGMVTRVAPEMQQRLLKLLLAISDGYGEEAARIAIQIGRPREGFLEAEFVERIASLVTEHQHKSVEQLEVGRIVIDIQGAAGRCGLRIPHELAMMGKTLMNLDEVVSTLAPNFDPNEALRNRAAEILRHRTMGRASLTAAYRTLLEATEFAQKLPARANRFAELLADNQVRLKVDAIDEKRLIAGMQKIANRITTGLVLAALIVAAANLMRTESTAAFAIAAFFFLLAGIFGLVLVFRAMFADESGPPKK